MGIVIHCTVWLSEAGRIARGKERVETLDGGSEAIVDGFNSVEVPEIP